MLLEDMKKTLTIGFLLSIFQFIILTDSYSQSVICIDNNEFTPEVIKLPPNCRVGGKDLYLCEAENQWCYLDTELEGAFINDQGELDLKEGSKEKLKISDLIVELYRREGETVAHFSEVPDDYAEAALDGFVSVGLTLLAPSTVRCLVENPVNPSKGGSMLCPRARLCAQETILEVETARVDPTNQVKILGAPGSTEGEKPKSTPSKGNRGGTI